MKKCPRCAICTPRRAAACIRCTGLASGRRDTTVPWGWRYCEDCLTVRQAQREAAGLAGVIEGRPGPLSRKTEYERE